jgi:hypothetical protein
MEIIKFMEIFNMKIVNCGFPKSYSVLELINVNMLDEKK